MQITATGISSEPTIVSKTLWQAYAAMIVGICFVSTAGIFVKWAAVPGPVAGFYRTVLAATLLFMPFMRQAQRVTLTRHSVLMALLGGVLFGCDIGTWSTAVQHTSVANAVLLGNTAPIWVSLGAIAFFREHLQPKFWLGLSLAMIGAAMIVGTDALRSSSLNTGNLLSLVASVFYAGYMLISQQGRVHLNAISYFWLATVGCVVTLFVFSRLLGQSLVVPPKSLPSLVGLAVITHSLGWLAINYAQGHIRASLVAPTMLGQPIVAALMAIFLLGESISLLQIIGGLIVISGIYLVHRSHG
jgi:drug/metabolite transporter (DMT)-like permease